jgi:hypothetical protein
MAAILEAATLSRGRGRTGHRPARPDRRAKPGGQVEQRARTRARHHLRTGDPGDGRHHGHLEQPVGDHRCAPGGTGPHDLGQLSAVMHAPEFQKLERSWTGLQYLVKNTSTSDQPADPHAQRHQARAGEGLPVGAGIRPEHAVQEDLRRGIRHLRRRALRRPDRRLRDQPPARRHLLPRADVARGRGQPCAPSSPRAAPELFGIESFGDLGKPRDLAKVFDTVEYAKWKAFRESEDSRYVGLTLPRFLGRLPYNPMDGMATEGFNFVEDVDGTDHQKYLWCNAAYAFATKLTKRLRGLRLVRGDPRRRGRRPGREPADPHLQDRRRRGRAEVPDRAGDHRPPREGAVGPGLHLAGALQEHLVRGLLRRPVGAEGEEVRQRRPTPTRCCPRSCSTSSPSRASPTT